MVLIFDRNCINKNNFYNVSYNVIIIEWILDFLCFICYKWIGIVYFCR